MTMEIKTPPNSKESEMMVLGSMLTSIDALNIAAGILSDKDFYYTEHKTLFQVLKEAHQNNAPADVHLVAEELKRTDKLKAVGGVGYLMALAQYAGTSAHIEEYAQLVKNKATLRRMIYAAQQVEKEAFEHPDDVVTALDKAQQLFLHIGQSIENEHKADSALEYLLDLASEDDLIKEIRNTSPGVRVGFELGKLDLKIPGGAITIVAGPTGHGKTMVLINFILNYLELHPDKTACLFSYEESRAAIQCLFLNTYINYELSKNNRESIKSYFRDGHVQFIAQHSQETFLEGKVALFNELIDTGRLRIFYSDCYAEELVQNIKFLKKRIDVGLVAVDYMQLLSLQNKKAIPRQEELKQICLMLKDCAIDTGLPLLLAAQFNRTVTSEADLSPTAIGEAGDIERAANMVIGIVNRNYPGNKGRDGKPIPQAPEMYMEVLKGRETGIGHSSVFNLDGNTGKLSPQQKMVKGDPHHGGRLQDKEYDEQGNQIICRL